MVAVRITRAWLVEAIRDEEKGAQEYARRGFVKMAGDERMHKAKLLRLLRRMDEAPEREDPLESMRRIPW